MSSPSTMFLTSCFATSVSASDRSGGSVSGEGRGQAEEVRWGRRVVGRVQGVGFRWWTERKARSLGVKGTVRNCPDGSVEVMAEGADDAMADFDHALRSGPAMARVEHVEEIVCRLPAKIEGFTILR